MTGTTTETLPPIVKTLTTPRDADTAFRVFVEQIDRWWPKESHSVGAGSEGVDSVAIALEPRQGGRMTETLSDGRTVDWGAITTFEPGRRLAMTWHPGSDPADATEVEVVFTPLADGGTRVELTHRGWERLADRGADMRRGYDEGWATVFDKAYAGAIG